jgi:hypothetical protein
MLRYLEPRPGSIGTLWQAPVHAIHMYQTSEAVLRFSREQCGWHGFLKQLLIRRENAEPQHLDASLGVIHLLLIKLV